MRIRFHDDDKLVEVVPFRVDENEYYTLDKFEEMLQAFLQEVRFRKNKE